MSELRFVGSLMSLQSIKQIDVERWMHHVQAVASAATAYVANWKIRVLGPRAANSSVLANCPMQTVSTKDIKGSPSGMESAGPANSTIVLSMTMRACHGLELCIDGSSSTYRIWFSDWLLLKQAECFT